MGHHRSEIEIMHAGKAPFSIHPAGIKMPMHSGSDLYSLGGMAVGGLAFIITYIVIIAQHKLLLECNSGAVAPLGLIPAAIIGLLAGALWPLTLLVVFGTLYLAIYGCFVIAAPRTSILPTVPAKLPGWLISTAVVMVGMVPFKALTMY